MADNPYPNWIAEFGTAVGDQWQDIANFKSDVDDAQYEWSYGSKDQCLYYLLSAAFDCWKALGHSNQMAGVTQPGVSAICTAFADLLTADDLPDVSITWKDIIAAWTDISDAARMWTITGIDQMRRNVWNLNPNIIWNENPFE